VAGRLGRSFPARARGRVVAQVAGDAEYCGVGWRGDGCWRDGYPGVHVRGCWGRCGGFRDAPGCHGLVHCGVGCCVGFGRHRERCAHNYGDGGHGSRDGRHCEPRAHAHRRHGHSYGHRYGPGRHGHPRRHGRRGDCGRRVRDSDDWWWREPHRVERHGGASGGTVNWTASLSFPSGTATAAGGTVTPRFTWTAATGAATASGGTVDWTAAISGSSGTATAGGGTATATVGGPSAAGGTATAAGGTAGLSFTYLPRRHRCGGRRVGHRDKRVRRVRVRHWRDGDGRGRHGHSHGGMDRHERHRDCGRRHCHSCSDLDRRHRHGDRGRRDLDGDDWRHERDRRDRDRHGRRARPSGSRTPPHRARARRVAGRSPTTSTTGLFAANGTATGSGGAATVRFIYPATAGSGERRR
jgi:hypothetical protein